ncbi:hypothetical protein BH11ACT6_BH11ACT6_46390 [soil metagenome]
MTVHPDKPVVVGAGPSGLSAVMHLARQGMVAGTQTGPFRPAQGVHCDDQF